ncbi:unnamed protein product [Bemisia tabaci]|uniref:Uncharacterized protein n=1 Tax=Bemisia tabaci TaxID=7038 RepID=A0A9N9ZZ24_BEMTA|nr:unnamed protein product [Bemisia tabaci]
MNAQCWSILTLFAATLLTVGALPVGNEVTAYNDIGPQLSNSSGVGSIEIYNYEVNTANSSYTGNMNSAADGWSTSTIVNNKTNGAVIVNGNKNYVKSHNTGDNILRAGRK